MIKGINKQILEVTNPESPYFDRIIFFVKPAGQSVEESTLKSEALKISASVKKPPKSKRTKKQIFQTIGLLILGLCAGASLGVILGFIA